MTVHDLTPHAPTIEQALTAELVAIVGHMTDEQVASLAAYLFDQATPAQRVEMVRRCVGVIPAAAAAAVHHPSMGAGA